VYCSESLDYASCNPGECPGVVQVPARGHSSFVILRQLRSLASAGASAPVTFDDLSLSSSESIQRIVSQPDVFLTPPQGRVQAVHAGRLAGHADHHASALRVRRGPPRACAWRLTHGSKRQDPTGCGQTQSMSLTFGKHLTRGASRQTSRGCRKFDGRHTLVTSLRQHPCQPGSTGMAEDPGCTQPPRV
jgi:hypothetical protein